MAMMWRPGKASRGVLVLVAVVCLLGYLLVQGLPQKTSKPYYREKVQAAKLMAQGMDVIRRARISIFGRIDQEHDPLGTGMIGSGLTPITSKEGVLQAKQATANPNWAAVLVHMFKRAKLKEGDVVAIASSGSFPSLALATLAAIEVLKLRPVIISSASASRWGANDPELTWLDMERLLFENRIIHSRSVAASLGGEQDRGGGIPPAGVRLLREILKRNGVELIDPPDLASSFDLRMNIYREEAGDQAISCYVNIGGGAGSVGSPLVKKMFQPGLNRDTPHPGRLRDSVMSRMSRDGIPVIHLVLVERLAKQYGLPFAKLEQVQKIGEGAIYAAMGYNVWLTWAVLIGLMVVIFVLLRMDLKHYLLRFNTIIRAGRNGAPGDDSPTDAPHSPSSPAGSKPPPLEGRSEQ